MRSVIGLMFFVLLVVQSAKAQSYIYGPTLSYQFQKGSAVKLGGYVLREVGFNSLIRADVTGNMTWTQGKSAVIPELAISYYFGNSMGLNVLPIFFRGEITPYTVTPKLGVSILTLLELDLGYGISMREKKDYLPIKGFTGSIRFNLPLNL